MGIALARTTFFMLCIGLHRLPGRAGIEPASQANPAPLNPHVGCHSGDCGLQGGDGAQSPGVQCHHNQVALRGGKGM